jgi:hypothetical protein
MLTEVVDAVIGINGAGAVPGTGEVWAVGIRLTPVYGTFVIRHAP